MKIEEQVLSREQMAHLVELGVDTSDASMCWLLRYDVDGYVIDCIVPYDETCYDFEVSNPCPTYTIGDLIYKVNNLFKDFSFTDNRQIDILYGCIRWMAENHKELIK